VVSRFIVFGQIVNLGMAVVTGSDAIARPSCQNLIQFQLAVFPAGIGIPGLQETAPTATAVVVGLIGYHVYEVLFAYDRLHNKPQIFRYRIAEALSNNLTGILNRKLDAQIPVPIGINLELALAYPFGVVLVDAGDLEIVLNAEFFQSGPD